jgi:putative Holliday junction resolvase
LVLESLEKPGGAMKRGRALGIDVGERRVGLAISDVTQTLASPFATLAVDSTDDAVRQVVSKIELLIGEDDELVTIIVGLPTKLDGSPTIQTARVEAFIETLAARTSLPIVKVDERLTSREAESRLAARERDWRRRKSKLDAAAAAVILQDYLDRQRCA